MSEARKGKIARLPYVIRHELNRRLRDGQTGATILAWLNALPETQAVLRASFGGEPVSDQNLSGWRAGGFQDWSRNEERMERIKDMSELAADMASAAGGSTADPACAIAGGRILEVLEAMPQDDLAKILPALTALRNAETAKLRAETDSKRAGLSAETLVLEQKKWAWRAAETMLDAINERLAKAQEIASSGAGRSDKIARLVNEFFEQ